MWVVAQVPRVAVGHLQKSLRPFGWRLCTNMIGHSSSSEDQPFDILALANRLQVGERKVRQAIYELHQEGLPRYTDGDHIPRSDAEVIAELYFAKRLPPQRLPDQVQFAREMTSSTESVEDEVGDSIEDAQGLPTSVILDRIDNERLGMRYKRTETSGRHAITVTANSGPEPRQFRLTSHCMKRQPTDVQFNRWFRNHLPAK
eukprot:TRINITY_DN94803_c0_g1_i1.p1 TRINITY_DN94803_c0_g1~~TRINITY_DN94803_c0_g1_i1.p1  ORF type:complete len:202 (+),score=30.32 TRINITY_DN94803_c0_g1_i1:83-688(+)